MRPAFILFSILFSTSLSYAMNADGERKEIMDSQQDSSRFVDLKSDIIGPLIIKEAIVPLFSISYEKSLSDIFSYRVEIDGFNYVMGRTTETSFETKILRGFSGVSLIPEVRYYPSKKMNCRRFFTGVYLRYMYLIKTRTEFESGTLIDQSNTSGSLMGVGVSLGYKQMIYKGFFIQPIIGFASGHSTFKRDPLLYNIDIDMDFDMLLLWRLECTVGYSIQW